MTKPLSDKVLGDQVTRYETEGLLPPELLSDEAHPSGQMTRQAHEIQRDSLRGDQWRDGEINFMLTKTVSREELEKMYPSTVTKSQSDEVTKLLGDSVLHGERL